MIDILISFIVEIISQHLCISNHCILKIYTHFIFQLYLNKAGGVLLILEFLVSSTVPGCVGASQ